MIISQQNAQRIVDDMKSIVKHDINIMDENGYIIASTNPQRCGQLHQGAVQLIQEGRNSLVISESDAISGSKAGINMPITVYGQTIGVIGITGAPNEVAVFGDVIKKMAELMVKSMQEEKRDILLDSAKRLFIENLLFAKRPDWSELEVRGRLLGLNIALPYTVAILQQAETPHSAFRSFSRLDGDSLSLRQMISNHLQENDYFTVMRDRIILLLCKAERSAAFYAVNRICQDIESYYGIHISCGVSNATASPSDIRRCYLEAQAASAVAVQTVGRRMVFYDEASLEFIVRSIPAKIMQNLRSLVFAGCSETETQEFTETIETYFKFDGDLKACAEHLIIHRNTYQYHVERVKKKTSFDLRKPKDAILLYLAVQAGEMHTE